VTCKCGSPECTHATIDDMAHKRSIEFFRVIGTMMAAYPFRWSITSGFRCAAHNAHCGGKPDSAHFHKVACDIQTQGPWSEVWTLAEKTGFFSAIIAYPKKNLIHLDVHPSDRVVRGYNFGDGHEYYLTLGKREATSLDYLTAWNLDEPQTPPLYVQAALDRETTA